MTLAEIMMAKLKEKYKYKNTHFYKISSKNKDIKDNYINYCIEKTPFDSKAFNLTKNNHKKYCNKDNYKAHYKNIYKFIRANGGWDNWEMKMIECYQGKNIQDVEDKLIKLIEINKSTLNQSEPYHNEKEYNKLNHDFKLWFNNNFITNDKEFNPMDAFKPSEIIEIYNNNTKSKLSPQAFSNGFNNIDLKIKRKMYNGYLYYYGFSKKTENNIKE